MKDSGVEWIGEIPAVWTVESSKGIFVARRERARKDDVMLTASQRFGMIPQERYDDAVSYKTVKVIKDEDILKHVEPGDFVISMRSFQGGLEYSEYRGKMSSAYLALYPRQGWPIADGYYRYLFKSHRYIQSLQRTSNLVRDGQALRYANFIQVPIPYPPLCEQQRIADYLDERCSAIDEVKRTLSDEIEALQRLRKATIHRAVTKGLDGGVPMRDSGVDWIGETPKTWDCCKQKYALTLINGRAYANDEFEQDGTYRILRVGNLFSNPDWYTSSLELPSDKYCNDGDLLYSWSMSYGPHIWHGEKVIYHYHIWKVRLTSRLNKSFAYYYLLALTDAIRSEIHETTMGFLTMGIMNDSYIGLPPLSEQERIADYLDERCAAIDSVIDTRTKQLERLEDYRRALIFAYVTGKKEVPFHE